MRSVEARTFRSPRWTVVAAAVSATLFLAGAFFSFRSSGLSWVTGVFFCLAPLAIAGLFDALTQRIELHQEHLVVVRNLRKREYPRSSFTKAQWGKGVPVSLQTTDGTWLHLPGVGNSGQGLVNTLRAWLKP